MGIAALLGLILPAVPSLIDLAEGLIKTPKAGQTKKAVVLQSLRALIAGVTATAVPAVPGAKPAPQVTDDELLAVIETIFAQKAASGTLGSTALPNQICLLQGSFTITPLVGKPVV